MMHENTFRRRKAVFSIFSLSKLGSTLEGEDLSHVGKFFL